MRSLFWRLLLALVLPAPVFSAIHYHGDVRMRLALSSLSEVVQTGSQIRAGVFLTKTTKTKKWSTQFRTAVLRSLQYGFDLAAADDFEIVSTKYYVDGPEGVAGGSTRELRHGTVAPAAAVVQKASTTQKVCRAGNMIVLSLV